MPQRTNTRPALQNVQPFIEESLANGTIVKTSFRFGDRLHTPFVVFSSMKNRLVVDFTPTNTYFNITTFKMQHITQLIPLLSNKTHFIKIDMKKAYNQIPLHPNNPLLIIDNKNNIYRYLGLPLGVSFAPIYFTKFMKYITAYLQQKFTVTLFSYIDDLLIFDDDKCHLQQIAQPLLQELAYLGFIVNHDKCIMTPSSTITFLGHDINTLDGTISVVQHKRVATSRLARHLAFAPTTTRRCMATLQGSIAAMLQGHQQARSALTLLRKSPTKFKWDHPFRITSNLRRILFKVSKLLNQNLPIMLPWFLPASSLQVFADASQYAMGVLIKQHDKTIYQHTVHFNRQQYQLHINRKETFAIQLALNAIIDIAKKQKLHKQRITLFTDNITARAHLIKRYTATIRSLLHQLFQLQIYIEPIYIPSQQNQADSLSRSRSLNDFRLNPNTLQHFLTHLQLPQPSIDLFASRHNAQSQRFCSLAPEVGATFINAFSIQWDQQHLGNLPYANPPFVIMGRTLRKMQQELQTRAIIIAPVWESAPWWPMLTQMSELILLLPQTHNLYLAPLGTTERTKAPTWQSVFALIKPQQHQHPSRLDQEQELPQDHH